MSQITCCTVLLWLSLMVFDAQDLLAPSSSSHFETQLRSVNKTKSAAGATCHLSRSN